MSPGVPDGQTRSWNVLKNNSIEPYGQRSSGFVISMCSQAQKLPSAKNTGRSL